jgi:HEPN domain-containing protein
MTEFTKTKITFALALLGTLFALHPIAVDRYGEQGFQLAYFDETLTIVKAYVLVAALLAFAVYAYGLALLTERPTSWLERLGNYAYALALMVFPLYGLLWLADALACRYNVAEFAWVTPAVVAVVAVLWLGASWWLRKSLGDQDRTSQVNQLAEHEIAALNRAREMFESNHYDLSVIEAWKALEARLRRVLIQRGRVSGLDTPQAMIDAARREGLLSESALDLVRNLREQWNIAVGVQPLTREAAEVALNAARNILATIPLADRKGKGKPVL